MPIYEYRCSNCETVFEHLQLGSSDSDPSCPSCQAKEVKKVLSAFSAVTEPAASPCGSGSCGLGGDSAPPCGACCGGHGHHNH